MSKDTVLIVDDVLDIREALESILTFEGFEVVLAEDGRAALNLLSQIAPPCVILLDLNMPFMTGAEFLQNLRDHPQFGKIPVIQMSAGRYPCDPRADIAIDKPFNVDELISKVEWACKRTKPQAGS